MNRRKESGTNHNKNSNCNNMEWQNQFSSEAIEGNKSEKPEEN